MQISIFPMTYTLFYGILLSLDLLKVDRIIFN